MRLIMRFFGQSKGIFLLWALLTGLSYIGITICQPDYNYSSSVECLADPLVPQYDGGIVVNPQFENGLEGWGVFGNGKIEVRKSENGNHFMAAYHRTHVNDSFSQLINLQQDLLYTFSAWVQVNKGDRETVVAVLSDPSDEREVLGSVIAQSGCWSFIKGGISVNTTRQSQLFFEVKNTNIEIWVDSVSLQPFTPSEWRKQQTQTIEKARQRLLRLHVTDDQGTALPGAQITVDHVKTHFPIGCGTADTIIDNKAYQEWFAARFRAVTFDNEMKWYYTEKVPGVVNYTVADAMLEFFSSHGIAVRGHNILWDNPVQNLEWVRGLSPAELNDAVNGRIHSVVPKYAGKLIAWDVMNENLHFSFFEDRIGPNASAMYFQEVRSLDPNTTPFLNEFNTLEESKDLRSTPSEYVRKIREIRSFPGNEEMVVGIGLQGHFGAPNIPYVRACLDTLGETKMPIWITELDVRRGPDQAHFLEAIMREVYSHPAVKGIIVWSGWRPTGCSRMCLTDNDFKNLPTGDVVDKLLDEWRTEGLNGATDHCGFFQSSIFHGEYAVTVVNPISGGVSKKHVVVSDKQFRPVDISIVV